MNPFTAARAAQTRNIAGHRMFTSAIKMALAFAEYIDVQEKHIFKRNKCWLAYEPPIATQMTGYPLKRARSNELPCGLAGFPLYNTVHVGHHLKQNQ